MSAVLNPEYLEKVIVKSLLEDRHFCVLMVSEVDKRYFDNNQASEIFVLTKEYYEKYMELPTKEILINISQKSKETEKYLNDLDSVEVSNEVFLYDQTEK